MKLRWYGQSAFLLSGEQHRVFIDPFGDIAGARPAGTGWSWPFPPIEGVEADLLLVTHDHLDHNGVEAIGGEPAVLDKPGTHESPVGEVVGIASEHDTVAGTQRGPNTIFRFTLDGTTVAHFGDFGQPALRPEQREALGDVDVLILPVGGGPTIAVDDAVALVRELQPAPRGGDALPHAGRPGLPRPARRVPRGDGSAGRAARDERDRRRAAAR